MPKDTATNLRTTADFKLREFIPIERPASFLLSNEGHFYINDNLNGRVYWVASDFTSAREVPLGEERLNYPIRIRKKGSNLFVYENGTIAVIKAEGGLAKSIKTFLRIEDFDLLSDRSYIATLGEIDLQPKPVVILDSEGKKREVLGIDHNFSYPEVERRAFIQTIEGRAVLCYKYVPLIEIFDIKERKLLHSINISSSIFPHLTALKADKEFTNPSAGIFRIAKYTGGLKVLGNSIYVLLHTPNPEILELDLEGQEIGRYIASETETMEYFGFEVQTTGTSRRFFVGGIDASYAPSLHIFETSDSLK